MPHPGMPLTFLFERELESKRFCCKSAVVASRSAQNFEAEQPEPGSAGGKEKL